MNTAMPGVDRSADRAANGLASPMIDESDRLGSRTPVGPAATAFEADPATSHRFMNGAASEQAAGAAGPIHLPPLKPDDPVAAALEQLRRNRATMVRSLAAARPRGRSSDASSGLDRLSLARTLGVGAISVTARQHPFVAVGAALLAGVTLARLLGRRSIVRPLLVAPLLSRVVAPIVMRMAADAAVRIVRGTAGRGTAHSSGMAERAGRGAARPPGQHDMAYRDAAYRGPTGRDTPHSRGGVPHPP